MKARVDFSAEPSAGWSVHDAAALERWWARRRLDPSALRRLRAAWYKRSADRERALACLPAAHRAALAQAVRWETLHLAERRDARVDGATKLAFIADDGARLETVILRAGTGRTALCVSTQVGCAGGCVFCASGRRGWRRNLSAAEILDQLVLANRLLAVEGRRVRNLVFMGMGEPLANEEALYAALETARAAHGFYLAERRLTVSTAGLPEAMVRCARRFPGVRLALSLHSARPAVRARLMPWARRHSLATLREALRQVTAAQGQPVLIEYLLLRDLNDRPADLDALIGFLEGVPVRINLLTLNPIAEAPELRPVPPADRQAFAQRLRASGLCVTQRYAMGSEIAAGCGQLAGDGSGDHLI